MPSTPPFFETDIWKELQEINELLHEFEEWRDEVERTCKRLLESYPRGIALTEDLREILKITETMIGTRKARRIAGILAKHTTILELADLIPPSWKIEEWERAERLSEKYDEWLLAED